jgi:SAM-dependent methyltransferase
MKQADHRQAFPDRSLGEVVRSAVIPELARRRPERTLLISPDPAIFPALGSWPLLTVHGGIRSADDPVACDTAALPFRDDAFDAVLLHHVFADGREPELDEAWRVLAGGGDIFVLGQGPLSRGWWDTDTPRLSVRQVCQRLRQRAFVIEKCVGSGLLGLPLRWERRWQAPLLPLATTIVIHGRHRPLKPIMRSLRYGQPHPVGVRSTAAEGLYRKAV